MIDSFPHRTESPDILDLVVQPDIKEFLTAVARMLPGITNILNASSKMIDVAEEILKDDELMESIEKTLKVKLDPLQVAFLPFE